MAMRIDILTLFPEMFGALLETSIVGRAIQAGAVEIHVENIRDFARGRYRKVDDAPFGGGPGMVMMCQPAFDAVEAVRARSAEPGVVVLLSPQGRRLDQKTVEELAAEKRLILVAGHYCLARQFLRINYPKNLVLYFFFSIIFNNYIRYYRSTRQ